MTANVNSEQAGAGLAATGWLLGAVSLVAAVEAFGLLRRHWLYLWPGLLLAGGLAAAAIVVRDARQQGAPLRRALGEARLRFAAWPATLAVAGGLGEALRAAGVLAWPAGFVWPICLLTFGGLVMARAEESQPETASPGRARQAGAALILAGLLRGFEAIFGIQPGAVGTGWFVVLFVAAWLLRRGPQITGGTS